MWKLESGTDISEYYQEVKDECNRQSYGYKIKFKGEFIPGNITFENADILEDDYLFLDVKNTRTGWCLYNDEITRDEKCDSCSAYKELKFPCSCKKVH